MEGKPKHSHRPPVDWEALARTLGGDANSGGSEIARRALEEIIGADAWRAAVDLYVREQRGYLVAWSVLRYVRPWAAMLRCREISRRSKDPNKRQSAVLLLRDVGDRRVLRWIHGYLNDADEAIQNAAAGIVDQLLWSELIEPNEGTELVREMSLHSNAYLREKAEFINDFLRKRAIGERSTSPQEG